MVAGAVLATVAGRGSREQPRVVGGMVKGKGGTHRFEQRPERSTICSSNFKKSGTPLRVSRNTEDTHSGTEVDEHIERERAEGKRRNDVQQALCYSYIGLWEWCCVIEERNVDDERNACGVCLTSGSDASQNDSSIIYF